MIALRKKFASLIFILLASFLSGKAQSALDSSTVYVVIDHVLVDGNHRTKPFVILRQLTFAEGDTILIDDLKKKMETSKNNLINIGLFNEVAMNIKNRNTGHIDLAVSVKERWYIFPLPSLEMYDRNFNVWWVEHDHDWVWLQYGVRFLQQNVRGRDEDLRATALFGFSRRFEFQYYVPYFDRQQKNGFQFTSSFQQNRNITYVADSNKEVIFQNVETFQKKTFYTTLEFIHHPGFHYRWKVSLSYNYNQITDTIAQLNPDYFLNEQTEQQYLTARISFTRDTRDIAAYPLTGSYTDVAFIKNGLGWFDNVNMASATLTYSKYVHLGKKWYASTWTKGKFSFPKDQPYNLQHGLGYASDYIAGYEYYLIDGQSYAYTKLNLKNQLLNIHIPAPAKNPLLKGAKLPITFYGRVYAETGYVKDDLFFEGNSLRNSLLIGGGVGIDIVMLYDTALRLEYSVNRLGNSGLFLHYSSFF